MKHDTEYQLVTERVKVKMRSLDVVFPRRYSMLFADVAKGLDVDLGPEAPLTNERLDDKVVGHAKQLSESATKAVDAMEEQDQARLLEVLAETKVLQAEIDELRSAVYQDTLTKVFNRRWMSENYLDAEECLKKDGQLAMIDLNDFKYINDTFGHIIGDRVLFFIASQLRGSGGHVVRYGGDEFFVLFDGTHSKDKARLALHKIRESVIKRMLNADGKKFTTSFSYGIAEFISGNSMKSVVQLADEAMYADKVKIKERLRRDKVT